MTIDELLHEVEGQLLDADVYFGHGTDNAWDDAVALVLHALALPIDVDASIAQENVTDAQYERVQALVTQRINARIPVPYLTHKSYFAGLEFYVNEHVLIPRSPLAELIHQHFQPWVKPDEIHQLLEIGTGSGCIAIACAKAFPAAHIDATDIDCNALEVAKINRAKHQVEHQVELIESDLFAHVPNKQYDVIISNPPYVDAEDMASLPKEYLHEPQHALAAGQDGLACVDVMLREAKKYLTLNGIMIVEVGNSAHALEIKYPRLAFTWLEFEHGGDGVFLVTREQLAHEF